MFRALPGNIPKDPPVILPAAGRNPWCTYAMKMLQPMQHGRASDCQQRRNGNMQRAQGKITRAFTGVKTLSLPINGGPISSREVFRMVIPLQMVLQQWHRYNPFRPMHLDCTTWKEMSGNGVPI